MLLSLGLHIDSILEIFDLPLLEMLLHSLLADDLQFWTRLSCRRARNKVCVLMFFNVTVTIC